eukprot:11936619-Ditylum_brightwellii.AAC.2
MALILGSLETDHQDTILQECNTHESLTPCEIQLRVENSPLHIEDAAQSMADEGNLRCAVRLITQYTSPALINKSTMLHMSGASAQRCKN